jgi:Uma2 family endonuclease
MPEHALTEALTHEGPWTEQDYLALPEDNRRIELLDGGLLMSPNPANPHQRLLTRFWRALDEAVPTELEVLHTVNIRVGPGKILIPDLAVITTPGAELVVNDAQAVVMVVEITSPGNVAFDRAVKPQLYAAAGIPHYVRIELGERGPTARVFALADDRYVERRATAPDEPLVLTEPFAVTVDLATLATATRPPVRDR